MITYDHFFVNPVRIFGVTLLLPQIRGEAISLLRNLKPPIGVEILTGSTPH
jgi:hypothetical protein